MRPLNIQEEAAQRWRSRCPCCRRPMTEHSTHGKATPSTTKTAGHNVPVSLGGSKVAGLWVYICHRCNNEQDTETFASWAYLLERAGDERAPYVREVAELFDEWRARDDVLPPFGDKMLRTIRSLRRA